MKKILLIICVMTMLAGCTGKNVDNNSLYEGTTEASTTETTAVTASPTIETVTEPTTEPPIRQLNSHIKELDLSRIENSEYSFVSENDYVDFNLRFTSDKELYVYAGQFLYVVSLNDEIADSVTEEIYQNPIEAYKSALQAKDSPHCYTLYDMDKDGIPELLIKYGTSEADCRFMGYTYKNGLLKEIAGDIPCSHTSFAYDYVSDQFVLAMGHMGYGYMTWYDIDENGVLRRLTSTDTLDFNSENGPTYSDYMDKYNVAFLDCSGFFQLGDEKKTWLYSYSSGEYLREEYKGFDYRFLENYPF